MPRCADRPEKAGFRFFAVLCGRRSSSPAVSLRGAQRRSNPRRTGLLAMTSAAHSHGRRPLETARSRVFNVQRWMLDVRRSVFDVRCSMLLNENPGRVSPPGLSKIHRFGQSSCRRRRHTATIAPASTKIPAPGSGIGVVRIKLELSAMLEISAACGVGNCSAKAISQPPSP